jgi:hypothetical protein
MPAALATSKIVFTFRYECGQIGLQVFGSTGNVDGTSTVFGSPVIFIIKLGSFSSPGIPWPASSRVTSMSSGES